MKRWIKRLVLAIAVLIIIAWIFSPYKHQEGFTYRLVKATVKIDAPAERVFRFLGNSSNAAKWSVFVDHISTLNAAEIDDGKAGSIRRCYRYATEQGTRWDEVVIEVIANKKRQIGCYHLLGFPVSAEGLRTEQLYKPVGEDGCELTFTLFYTTPEPSWWDEVKLGFTAYYIKNIFAKNMNNIKRIVEKRVPRML